jgi:hypothetical protein
MPVSTSKIAGRVFLFTGIGSLLLALCLAIGTVIFIRQAATAQATVVALIEKTDPDEGNIDYFPQFTFSTPDGTSFTINSNNGTNPPEFKRGQQVNVLYDRANPSNARIDSFVQLWLLPLIFGSLGIFFIATVWLIARFMPKKAANSPPA